MVHTKVVKDRPLPRVKEMAEVLGRKAWAVTSTSGTCVWGGGRVWGRAGGKGGVAGGRQGGAQVNALQWGRVAGKQRQQRQQPGEGVEWQRRTAVRSRAHHRHHHHHHCRPQGPPQGPPPPRTPPPPPPPTLDHSHSALTGLLWSLKRALMEWASLTVCRCSPASQGERRGGARRTEQGIRTRARMPPSISYCTGTCAPTTHLHVADLGLLLVAKAAQEGLFAKPQAPSRQPLHHTSRATHAHGHGRRQCPHPHPHPCTPTSAPPHTPHPPSRVQVVDVRHVQRVLKHARVVGLRPPPMRVCGAVRGVWGGRGGGGSCR